MCFNKDSGANTSITILMRICSWHLRWAPHRAEHLIHTTQKHVIDCISLTILFPSLLMFGCKLFGKKPLPTAKSRIQTDLICAPKLTFKLGWNMILKDLACANGFRARPSTTLRPLPSAKASIKLWVFSINTRFSAGVCLACWDQRSICWENN